MGRGYFSYLRLLALKFGRLPARVAKIAPSQISYPGNKKGPAIGVDRGAALSLVAVRAVGAAAAGGVGAGATASLVGVVEAATLKLDAAGRERLGSRSAAARAYDLGGL